MAAYCLKNGKIQQAPADAAGRELTAIFHLSRDGSMTEPRALPVPAAGEGMLAYEGAFYIEPLEVQIEFLKAADSKQWLEALLLRHAHRVRQVSEELSVIAEIKEVVP